MSKDIETIEEVINKKLQFFHHNCPADLVVNGYSDLEKCTCGIKEAIKDSLNSIQKIIEKDVIGEDISLDEARHMQRVVRDETNGTRHALNPNAVIEALAVNTKLTMQRQALTNALYGKGEDKG